jgi:hypothetical protein
VLSHEQIRRCSVRSVIAVTISCSLRDFRAARELAGTPGKVYTHWIEKYDSGAVGREPPHSGSFAAGWKCRCRELSVSPIQSQEGPTGEAAADHPARCFRHFCL